MKNVLIINSSKKLSRLLVDLLIELDKDHYCFYNLSCGYLGPRFKNNFNLFFFLICLPFFYLYYFPALFRAKGKKKIEAGLCFDWNEKIIFTPLARILRLKIIWLEYPEIVYKDEPRLLMKIYKFFSRWAVIVAMTAYGDVQLKNLGIKHGRIIPPGIRLDQFKNQSTIFSKLAESSCPHFNRKFFTVGTITNLTQSNQIENLFKAARKCLTVIPNLQLLIVGAGPERKNLAWLAKKMDINNVVWFVGGGAEDEGVTRPKKWLESFDVFVITDESLNLDNLAIVLRAMAVGLPVIGPRNRGFEDIVRENETGRMVTADNSEALTEEIIKLEQDRRLRVGLGRRGQELVNKDFRIEQMVKGFKEVLG